jgi:hypothetical protein
MKLPITSSFLKTAALLVSLGSFTGSATVANAPGDRLFTGARRASTVSYRTSSVEGYLLVYSATDEVSDGDTEFYPHSSYVIYSSDGKFLRNVDNHMSRSDEIPRAGQVSSWILHPGSSVNKRWICPRSRADQAGATNNSRPRFAELNLREVVLPQKISGIKIRADR